MVQVGKQRALDYSSQQTMPQLCPSEQCLMTRTGCFFTFRTGTQKSQPLHASTVALQVQSDATPYLSI